MLRKGNFHIKGWTLSGGVFLNGDGKEMGKDPQQFLAVSSGELEKWEAGRDLFKFEIKLIGNKPDYKGGRDLGIESGS